MDNEISDRGLSDAERVANAHAHAASEVLDALASGEQGLTQVEVAARITIHGANKLDEVPPEPAWKRFLTQFHNVLIYVLIVAAVVSGVLQHYVDSGVIFGVVLINAIVGYLQEGKAEAALRAILSMTRTRCMVVRDGMRLEVDSEALVPGDVVSIQAGDRIPADIRIFYCKGLRCDESALTGESVPVDKQCAPVSQDKVLAERTNMAYMGTMASLGLARGVVCRTGLDTEIGSISSLVAHVSLPETPLQQQLARFARQLSLGILGLSALSMLFGVLFRGYQLADMFQAAIGIAVASIPEGLPAIVTISLAIGVQRMARKKALVRRLPSVEVLGSVDVICSDKTGTLTSNAMTARRYVAAACEYSISGEGYSPAGGVIRLDDGRPLASGSDPLLNRASLLAILCNEANVLEEGCEWQLYGDPTEGALLVMGMKFGFDRDTTRHEWRRIDELPFDTEQRYMATLHHNPEGERLLAVKGAPDRLLPFCCQQLGLAGIEPLNESHWRGALHRLAEEGMRVIALAERQLDVEPPALGHDVVSAGLTMVGLVGISDPPRPEAIDSVLQCQQAGIRVKMITGDNPVTAKAIGRELGLNTKQVCTGAELDALGPNELREVVERVDIFARTTPANKLLLVQQLRASNHIVAMTGDGVNDAPALRQADIGVTMGKKGTDVAREAADIVLTDDNFHSIAAAVIEGRTVYDNIAKSIFFILPTNLAEAAIIILAILFGFVLPITPAQILWINMVTAVTLALALAFELPETDIMLRKPRPVGQGLITARLLTRLLLVGIPAAVMVASLFNYWLSQGASLDYARTIAVNALVMIEAVYLLNCRFLTQSIFSMKIFSGMLPALIAIVSVLLIQLLFTYLPISQRLFGLADISALDWLLIVAASLPTLLVVECEKYLWRRAG